MSSTGAGRTRAFMFGLGDECANMIHVQPERRDKRQRPVPARFDTGLVKDGDAESVGLAGTYRVYHLVSLSDGSSTLRLACGPGPARLQGPRTSSEGLAPGLH